MNWKNQIFQVIQQFATMLRRIMKCIWSNLKRKWWYFQFSIHYHVLILKQKAVGKISFTTDAWTDPNKTSFMAVTAHWIEATGHKTLQLQADLIGFHHLPGWHTGEHLAHCFLFITDHLKITGKVCSFFWNYGSAGSNLLIDWMDHLW